MLIGIGRPGLPVAAEDIAVIGFSMDNQLIMPGRKIILNITVEPNRPISNVSLNMSFDPSLVSVVGVKRGTLFKNTYAFFHTGTIDNTAGTITGLGNMIADNGAASEPGTLAVITLAVGLKSGVCRITLSDVIVKYANGETSISFAKDQFVIIDPAATNTITTDATKSTTTTELANTLTPASTTTTLTLPNETLPISTSLATTTTTATPSTTTEPTNTLPPASTTTPGVNLPDVTLSTTSSPGSADFNPPDKATFSITEATTSLDSPSTTGSPSSQNIPTTRLYLLALAVGIAVFLITVTATVIMIRHFNLKG